MIHDAHVYCLPPRLRDPKADLPPSERKVLDAIYRHAEGPLALGLSSPESILDSMTQAQITGATLVAFPWSSLDLCRETNDFILSVCAQNAAFKAICSIQPLDAGWQKEAERCIQAGASGIKINPDWQGYRLDDPQTIDVGKCLIDRRAFLMTHVDQPNEASGASPQHLYNLAKALPDLRILAAHMGGLLGLSSLHAPVSKTLQNVWFDTAVSSTLQTVSFYVQAGLEDRILFGSDFPFNHSHSQAQVVEGIRNLKLGSAVEQKIFSGNWEKLNQWPKK